MTAMIQIGLHQILPTMTSGETIRMPMKREETRPIQTIRAIRMMRILIQGIRWKSLVLPNVQFYTNSNRLLPSSAKDLDRLSLYLLEHLACKANIYGHTDSRGNDNSNLRLSQARANSVRAYLIEKGIDPVRLKAIGKGETEPRASNDSQEGMLMNRRVEIEIIHGRKIKPRKK
jgi:outer membrane protein OmpA-like peptidoglycan-associated protein